MKKIRFSAGHGQGIEHNRGALLFNEGDENLTFTDILSSKLKDYEVDVKEIRRERGNFDHSLGTRSAYGSGADLFYSSHSNAATPTVSGVEIILSYQSLDYYNFAQKLCKLIADTLSITNRGVKFRNNYNDEWENYSQANKSKVNWFGELRNNKAKCAMIVEHFFHTNIEDSKKYLAKKGELSRKIVELISQEFSLKKIGSAQETQKIDSSNQDKLYQVSVGAFAVKANADKLIQDLKDKGFKPYFTLIDNPNKKVEKPKLKPVSEIAKEVLLGKWGNGEDRRNRLKNAGYNPDEVQNQVNKLI